MTDYNAELLKFPGIFDGRTTLTHNPNKHWGKRDPAVIKGLVFHQSLEEIGTAEANAKYHSGPNHLSPDGLPGLSYTLFCERVSGRLVMANDVECKTWSQGDASKPGDENALYMSVCFGGNFSGTGYKGIQAVSKEQLRVATDFWAFCKKLWGWKNNQLFGHYDFGKPACPGNELSAVIANINSKKDWDAPKYNLTASLGRQEAMRALGYYKGDSDGIWGPLCRAALVAFQRDHGLATDGVWGQATSLTVAAALEASP